MHEEQGFIDELREHPEDDVTRLVYADWLEDCGDPRAAYLRAEVALARMVEGEDGFEAAEAELVDLREGIETLWLEQAGRRWDVLLFGLAPAYKLYAIKLIREMGPYGIGEGKVVVESAPHVLLIAAPRYEAEVARQHLLSYNPLAKIQVQITSNAAELAELLRKARKYGFMSARWFPTMLNHLPRPVKLPTI